MPELVSLTLRCERSEPRRAKTQKDDPGRMI